MPKTRKIVLPETQWWSARWAVQWRRGRDYQHMYEVTYEAQRVATVAVTRAGWKWSAPKAGTAWYRPWVWSADTFETWQEAVAAFAKRFRRRADGRGCRLPGEWSRGFRVKGTPWTPRPVHDDWAEGPRQ